MTPKLPPPPRMPQKRSSFSVALTFRSWPSAVTEIGRQEVVAGQAEATHQVAEAAAQREPGDPRRGHEAAGGRQAEGLGLAVELAPGDAGFGPHRAARRVDPDPLHPGQVNHQPIVAHREARHAVAAPADGDQQVVGAREVDGADHIGRSRTPGDQAGRRSIAAFQTERAAS